MEGLLYIRKNRGQIGVRNHVVIVPTTSCVNSVVREIGKRTEKIRWGEHNENRVVPIIHNAGCCHVTLDEDVAFRLLLGTITHPNVGGAIIVSLGCGQFCKPPGRQEASSAFMLYRRALERGMKNVGWINVMDTNNGTEDAVENGIKFVEKIVEKVAKEKREPHRIGDLSIAIVNGASDATSGLYTNRAVGHFVDEFILGENGTVVFSQLTEVIGAENYLLSKSIEPAKRKLKRAIETTIAIRKGLSREMRMSDPTPGNIRAGISTLAEKAIGTLLKVGIDPNVKLKSVIAYGETIPHRGLYMMEGPGHDLTALTGMAAGGAQIAIFTTGLGTPVGHALLPVIKVTANEETFKRMQSNIDIFIDASRLYDGISLKDSTINLLKKALVKYASGELVKAEVLGFLDFTIRSMWMLQ
ncbi:MAG: UxaA family hydrolase [Candidatus Korarchaeota archaeon]